MDPVAVEKRLRKPGALDLLSKYASKLAALDDFTLENTEAAMQQLMDEEQIKVGDIIHAVRVALTGKAVGIGVFETLVILGKESALKRMELACKEK